MPQGTFDTDTSAPVSAPFSFPVLLAADGELPETAQEWKEGVRYSVCNDALDTIYGDRVYQAFTVHAPAGDSRILACDAHDSRRGIGWWTDLSTSVGPEGSRVTSATFHYEPRADPDEQLLRQFAAGFFRGASVNIIPGIYRWRDEFPPDHPYFLKGWGAVLGSPDTPNLLIEISPCASPALPGSWVEHSIRTDPLLTLREQRKNRSTSSRFWDILRRNDK